jgi:hypothetical protein
VVFKENIFGKKKVIPKAKGPNESNVHVVNGDFFI